MAGTKPDKRRRCAHVNCKRVLPPLRARNPQAKYCSWNCLNNAHQWRYAQRKPEKVKDIARKGRPANLKYRFALARKVERIIAQKGA